MAWGGLELAVGAELIMELLLLIIGSIGTSEGVGGAGATNGGAIVWEGVPTVAAGTADVALLRPVVVEVYGRELQQTNDKD